MPKVTTKTAVFILGISKTAVCSLLRKGVLKGEKIKGKWQIDIEHLKQRKGLTPPQFGGMVGQSGAMIRYFIRKGKINATRIGGRWYIDKEELKNYVD